MIGKIKGTVSEIDGNEVLIETVSGLFYKVYFTNALLETIVENDEVEVYTYHLIREDSQMLFGFEHKKEYRLFELLLTVQGVGPKSAFMIVSESTGDKIINAVRQNDHAYFTRIKGLGKKTALKIILELSQKFHSEFTLLPDIPFSNEDQTVHDALLSLGFESKDIGDILSKISKDASIEDKLKEAIGLISSRT
ncbi:Holliday junction branch migration protein RuvA [Candidatus Roizmanbacteria bacterium CG11_big_fil_rev_8_21_14_0_20_36_8]|uniref:Holliday junction branch migration complex subunit RuvA n=1 Tax=Candidatus Roizmanbacteria bacterium CG11_big_fil_rev_8_21_14_0_20_36_8 TaxID=1974856 RepID=A0A2M6IUJ0_9BACT|nr:MAG: Holliday junction branch migration protein RuvA [Candidatus Roizmanbacteria bacterium CG11_big_fil_rev_8_21_14_0_20_36_8]